MVTAIVLAAGESTRMGQPKQLLSWHGKTMLEAVLDGLSRSRLDKIVVVLGHQAGNIAPRIAGKPVEIVRNRQYRLGMASSIRTGLRQVEPDSAVLLFLADQPLVSAATIDRLIGEHNERRGGIIVPVHKGKRGNPVLFDAKYRDELMKLRGDIGGRQIVAAHPDDVFEVETDESVLRDLDTEADYLRARQDEGSIDK